MEDQQYSLQTTWEADLGKGISTKVWKKLWNKRILKSTVGKDKGKWL